MAFNWNPNVTMRFKRDQKTMPAIPARSSVATQKYNHEYHNLASDYMHGKTNRHESTPDLTFDQYIDLVTAFAELAKTVDAPALDTDALIDAAVSGDITCIPASPEDFVRSYGLQETP